jgi:hypothetical protein
MIAGTRDVDQLKLVVVVKSFVSGCDDVVIAGFARAVPAGLLMRSPLECNWLYQTSIEDSQQPHVLLIDHLLNARQAKSLVYFVKLGKRLLDYKILSGVQNAS